MIVPFYAERAETREAAVASVECLAALARAGKLKDPDAVRSESRLNYELLNSLHARDQASLSAMACIFGKTYMLYAGAGYISVSDTARVC